MKKRLIIVGAGGFGREVYGLITQQVSSEWEVYGFLDDNPSALEAWDLPHKIIGDIAHYQPSEREVFLPAIGMPKSRLPICRALQKKGAHFINFIHPHTTIGKYNKIGNGSIIYPGTRLTSFITIGDYVNFTLNASVGHDVQLADGCSLSGHTEVNGACQLGEGVFMGSHATILPRIKIGDYAVVGAGSVVVSTIKAGMTVMGIPAVMLTKNKQVVL